MCDHAKSSCNNSDSSPVTAAGPAVSNALPDAPWKTELDISVGEVLELNNRGCTISCIRNHIKADFHPEFHQRLHEIEELGEILEKISIGDWYNPNTDEPDW